MRRTSHRALLIIFDLKLEKAVLHCQCVHVTCWACTVLLQLYCHSTQCSAPVTLSSTGNCWQPLFQNDCPDIAESFHALTLNSVGSSLEQIDIVLEEDENRTTLTVMCKKWCAQLE